MQPSLGAVTMLFTDIEGSTRIARTLGDRWPDVLMAHHSIVRKAIEDAGGSVEHVDGDAFFAVFEQADDAVACADSAQRALRGHAWPHGLDELRVRMGLHTADVDRVMGQHVGVEVHRAARIGAAANGGQVILSEATRRALTAATGCDELGEHRLKDFPEPTTLLHLRVDDRAAEFPPPRTLDVRPTNLPPSHTTLVGRDAEVEAVREHLLSGRASVVTLTGLGGAGKTTTALAVATLLLDHYAEGVWLVRAESLTEAGQLLTAIAETLWVRDVPGGDLLRLVVDRLTDRRILLVLDNLEQVEGAPQMVAEIVERTRSLGVLATSRAPLGLAGERVVPLGPLPSEAAAELLLDRAEATGARVSAEALDAVPELCERLGRLPLAIELVAPRLRLFAPRELLERLGSVADLTTSAVDRPERHRSVRAAVEWSVGLLADAPRSLFRRLAIFQGPVPLEIVDDVCCWDLDVADAISVLLDFSLVQRTPTGFALVTTVRDLAAEMLASSGSDERLRRSHATAMVSIAGRVRSFSGTREDLEVERAVRADSWAAAEWARTADPALHRELVLGLGARWGLSGQLRRALEEVAIALADETISPAERGALSRLRAYLLTIAHRPDEALAAAEEAVRLLEEGPLADRGHALVTLSQAKGAAGRPNEAVEAALSAVAVWRRLGEAHLLARGLLEVSQARLLTGDVDGAHAALTEAEPLIDPKYPEQHAWVVSGRADWAMVAGDFRAAIDAHAEGLEKPDSSYAAWSIASMADAFFRLGDAEAALEMGAMATAMADEMGTDVDAFTQFGSGVRETMTRARGVLTSDAAWAAERAGRDLPAGQRLVRARELARRAGSRASERAFD